jgi:hypothetical protein
MHQCWGELAQLYEEIEGLFDRLQLIYRPMTVTTVRSPLGLLVTERSPAWRRSFGRVLEIDRPDGDDSGDFDPMYLGLGLDAFVAWRAVAGDPNRLPILSWRIVGGCFEVAWSEASSSGRSLAPAQEFGIAPKSRPAVRVDSLALPLLARVVAAHNGTLETTSDPAFEMKLRWPQFRQDDRSR